jgi:hypothetical protein
MATRWLLAVLAVLGAFFAAGLLGALVADALGRWYEPAGGFAAALSVVVVAYLAAPSHRLPAAMAALAIGACIAWHFLAPSSYPESYGDKAYEPTYLPLIATCAGGLLGLLLAAFHSRRRL